MQPSSQRPPDSLMRADLCKSSPYLWVTLRKCSTAALFWVKLTALLIFRHRAPDGSIRQEEKPRLASSICSSGGSKERALIDAAETSFFIGMVCAVMFNQVRCLQDSSDSSQHFRARFSALLVTHRPYATTRSGPKPLPQRGFGFSGVHPRKRSPSELGAAPLRERV